MAPGKRYNYILLQNGSLPLAPNSTLDPSIEHSCTSVLVWPEGEQPSAGNTVLTDPCFTDRGFRYALRQLDRLGLSLVDIGRIFVTHGHQDHLLCLPSYMEQPGFADFQAAASGPLSGISTVPCPGHAPDLRAIVFRSSSSQKVWVVGDAVLNVEWLKAWAYYWPNDYSPSEVVLTWKSVAEIFSHADLVLPGHGQPIPVTASLVRQLLSTFTSAAQASKCQDVEQALSIRLEQLLTVASQDLEERST